MASTKQSKRPRKSSDDDEVETTSSIRRNLNLLKPDGEGHHPRRPVTRYSTAVTTMPSKESERTVVEAHIGDIIDPLLRWIASKESEPHLGCFAGCVAWLTNHRILDALASSKHYTNIVVQKEDFLRRDMEQKSADTQPSLAWKQDLRRRYERLSSPELFEFHTSALGGLDWVASLPNESDPVRCVGYHSTKADKHNRPNMHHKFLVFCQKQLHVVAPLPIDAANQDGNGHEMEMLEAIEVWTGSFNMSLNATASRENAVLIRDARIAELYKEEWGEMVSISEPLDWTSSCPEPEYWEGT